MSIEPNNLLQLLKSKEIIEILDGDTHFGNIEIDSDITVPLEMPNLSGAVL